MSMNIKSKETHRRAKELAKLAGETMAEAVDERLEQFAKGEILKLWLKNCLRWAACVENYPNEISAVQKTCCMTNTEYRVDTSALIAILKGEDDAPAFARAIAEADPPFISAGTLIETGIVVFNLHGASGSRLLDEMILDGGFRIENVTAHQVQVAREAYSRYGKAPKKKGLNYGDCFSYALAKAMDLPLLFKGENFPLTDIEPALLP